jgi:hypothetical protein
MRHDGYAETSKALLEKARAELQAGDLIQASEKGWGAAAHIVKAVAQRRGWQHGSHRLLFEAVNRLAQETNDPELRRLFRTAGFLHTNFYENWQPREFVEDSLADVDEIVAKIERIGV